MGRAARDPGIASTSHEAQRSRSSWAVDRGSTVIRRPRASAPWATGTAGGDMSARRLEQRTESIAKLQGSMLLRKILLALQGTDDKMEGTAEAKAKRQQAGSRAD